MTSSQKKLLFLSSLGGVLEFYDFIIYALFASYLAHTFFPVTRPLLSLMLTFATFAIGYLVRPLGGIIFGHFGDRIGRKSTFTVSILLMAIATLGIGCTPAYSQIGIAAPIIVLACRILQGISIGGEIPGAITYVSESIPEQKGLACGIIFCALTMGIVVGSVVHALVVSMLTDMQMQAYGFRLPFIIGGMLGLLSYTMRRKLRESTQFQAVEKNIERFPLVTVIRQQGKNAINGALITALCAAIVTVLFLFIPAYFTDVLNLPATTYLWERTAAVTLGSCLSLFFGFLTDYFDTKKLILVLCLLLALFAYPIFAIYVYFPQFYMIALLLSALLMGFSAGTIPSFLSQLFPTKIRYSGIAVSYNLGFAFFGGFTPFISFSLIYYSQIKTAPAFYLLVVTCLAFMSLAFARPQANNELLAAK
ncbi:Major facilitator family transporter [Legionella beliardensis]|uniref:Major facilitator family transporter n=1 Tax=Legionella beliardensis TaxID=91822 RepID=A0A378I4I7_9GAMM|nr:MFS transporter [Legionella beliardensis]STX29923.1 Major facilitator family transporter [Legionella beliardensis]